MRAARLTLLLTSLVAAAAAASACGSSTPPPPALPAARVDPATAGRINGHVRYDGEAHRAEVVRIGGDRNCVALNGSDQQPADVVVLGTGNALQNVFVYVNTGLEKASFPVPNEPVTIDQQKCRYVPRVIGVRVGQPLHIRNGDPLLHNVRADPEVNQPFNQGQPAQGMAYTHTFTTREVMVPIKCDVHAWMRSYVGALEHPYFAVTGADGGFTLANLPPGTYTITAWHERLGTRDAEVTLDAKDTKDVDFTFAR